MSLTCSELRKLLESTVYAATLEGSMTDDEKPMESRVAVAPLEPGAVNAAMVDLVQRYVTAFSPVMDALGQAAVQLGESWQVIQRQAERDRG